MLGKLKGLDLHPRFREEFRERTTSGGVVSVVSTALITFLFISHLWAYFTPGTVDTMSVDDTRGAPLRIHFDVVFPAMPCALVNMDVMDASGQHQLDLDHNVFKRSMDENGRYIDETHRNKLGQTLTHKDQLAGNGTHREDVVAKAKAMGSFDGSSDDHHDGSDATPECGSCFGAGADGQCCNSCQEVRDAYRTKGWQLDPSIVAQCAKDSIAAVHAGDNKEGCNIYGFVEVPRVAGNIHFAPGRSLQHGANHLHSLTAFAVQNFNTSHKISSFSLGRPYAAQPKQPLDGHVKTQKVGDGNGIWQYFVKAVPLDVENGDGSVTSTFQYAVTEHYRHVSVSRGSGLPGVFFFYDISPIRVSRRPDGVSLLHFVTQLCAIIGGVFTMLGVVDSGVQKVLCKWKSNKALA